MQSSLALLVLFWGWVLGYTTVHDEVATASADASHGILSSSMQDYLNQISQLEIANPSIAVPGEWLTDAKKSFVFLPVRIPKSLPLNDVKLLTDGRSILVNVVERPVQAAEDKNTKKFRFILDSFKEQTAGKPAALTAKLQEWLSDEDNSKVRDLIQQTLSSMDLVKHKNGLVPRSLSIPLNTLELSAVREKIGAANRVNDKGKKVTGNIKKALRVANGQELPKISNPHGGTASIKLRSTYLQENSATSETGSGDGTDGGTDDPNLITIPLDSSLLQKLIDTADYVVPLSDKDAFTDTAPQAHGDSDKAYIKESFSVRIPYPTPAGRVFAVLQSSSQIVICMPFTKGSAVNSSPFERVPIFDMDGKKLEGSGSTSADLVPETNEKRREVSAAAVKTVQQKTAPVEVKEGKNPKRTPDEKLIPVGF
eukprot:gnl/MRDRNA2_/MRDRNA2_99648_c0_seq1.p1 gnl/MRDRNA2_/MRDRNA2_99648_c0~~gnl/MRDRNA2_/MRDRNA2_99648_c0_seq1.p1  ORF type:complete len:440 (+),score=101.85 gnl/MRDRNA2_/MRDRNA2_99648_c0_seq1:48-1322(+)